MHRQIVKRVQATTGRLISPQSEDQLFVVMRSTYLQYSNNNPAAYVEEVRWLNEKVLEYVVPNIITNMQHHIGYLNDISKLPEPIDRGEFVNIKGSTPLRSGGPWI